MTAAFKKSVFFGKRSLDPETEERAYQREMAWRREWRAEPIRNGREALFGKSFASLPGEERPMFWKLCAEGYPCMTFHPNQLVGDVVADLAERCKRAHLYLSIGGLDFYDPGRTLLVMVVRKQDLDAIIQSKVTT